MTGHRSTIRTVSALVLLLVFVGGGVLAPTVHRIHHGTATNHAASRLSADAMCDHAQHGVAFEVLPPALHDDPCVLCDRYFTSLAVPDGQVAASLRDAAHVPGADGLLFSLSSTRTTIRGPPSSA
jgi:hypothetical protein